MELIPQVSPAARIKFGPSVMDLFGYPVSCVWGKDSNGDVEMFLSLLHAEI